MKVTIIIPIVSFGRLSSLMEEIESIYANTYKNIHIVIIVDGDSWLYVRLRQIATELHWKDITIALNERRMDWVFTQNQALKELDSDYYICACDDFVFPLHCIEAAVKKMKKRFPDGFGVVGLWKRNNPIIALFGNKWIEHFPGRQMFCPDFTHYCGDSECGHTARKLGKLANTRGQQVLHISKNDETHSLSQKVARRDRELYYERERRGYKWGVDFNLIGKKNESKTI